MTNLRFLFSLTHLAQDNIILRNCAMGELESIRGTAGDIQDYFVSFKLKP